MMTIHSCDCPASIFSFCIAGNTYMPILSRYPLSLLSLAAVLVVYHEIYPFLNSMVRGARLVMDKRMPAFVLQTITRQGRSFLLEHLLLKDYTVDTRLEQG